MTEDANRRLRDEEAAGVQSVLLGNTLYIHQTEVDHLRARIKELERSIEVIRKTIEHPPPGHEFVCRCNQRKAKGH